MNKFLRFAILLTIFKVSVISCVDNNIEVCIKSFNRLEAAGKLLCSYGEDLRKSGTGSFYCASFKGGR